MWPRKSGEGEFLEAEIKQVQDVDIILPLYDAFYQKTSTARVIFIPENLVQIAHPPPCLSYTKLWY